MITKKEILEKTEKLIKDYFENRKNDFIPGKSKIFTMVPSFDSKEIIEVLESLLSTYVTMGKKVNKFEQLFSNYLDVKYSVMVNSGSSANLLAMSILSNPMTKNRIKPGDEVITPAFTWATTVYPIFNVNAIPVFVDVDLETFNINPEEIEKAITKKTKAILPVHLVGNPCEIKAIMEIAEKYNLFVVEDACEAHGAEVNGKKVGTFGDIGTFSFFFSHHITTIEGGMVSTDNFEMAEMAIAMRAFGWIRNLRNKDKIARDYSHIDPRVLFINLGFNIRPTEIQAAFGIHQIKKLEKLIKIKKKNAKYLNKRLMEYSDYLILQEERHKTRHSWFVYPIVVKPDAPFTRDELCEYLEKNNIETRLVAAGNIVEQPVIKLIKHKIVGELKNSRILMSGSFFVGNHIGIGKKEREYIADKISDFIESKVKK